ncbi:MAG TPA: hypothetical protein VI792_02955, partial [Candidatus Eisenbacteria bacterium]
MSSSIPPDDPGAGPPEESDPRSPLDPQRIVEEAREGVGHLVEEVREEVEELHDKIEDVVEEHLPRRVRWSAGRLAWLIVGSLVVALVVALGSAFVWVSRNSVWAAGELTRVINLTLAQHSNLVLDVHDLQGNPFKQVRLVNARVRVRGRDTRPILEAPSMSVAYTPWSLWLGRRRSIEITLDHPVIRLTRGPDGRLLLPEWKVGPRGPDNGHELEIILHCRGGTVSLPDSGRAIEDWNFDARALAARETRISVQRMSWSRGPYGSSLDALVGDLNLADSVRFRIAELHSPDLALRASGAWKSGMPGVTRVVSVDIDRVRWKWLAKVFENGVFDVPGEGRGHIEARGDRDWRGRITADAVWDSVAVAGSGNFSLIHGRLRVDPLALTSPIGALGGRFNYTADDWELQGDVRRGDPGLWGVLGLKGWPHGHLNGRMTLRNHRQGDQHATHLEATLLPSDLGGWRADSATTTIDFPISGPDTFAVYLVRRGGSFNLIGQVANGGWQGRYEAARFPLDEWEDGRKSGLKGLLAVGRGTVEGRDDGLHVTGALEGASGDWLGLRAARWRLEGFEGRLLPVPALDMTTRLRDVQFLGLHFDSAMARLHLGNQEVTLDSVVAQAGDTLVSAAGRSTWNDAGWQLSLDRAAADSRQFHWTAESPLELAGDPHGVEFRRFVAHDGAARLELGGRWAAAGGVYDWTGRAERLDLGRIGLPADWGVTGLSDATLRVSGPAGDPHWRLEAAAQGPGMNGHRADTLATVIEGRRSQLDVRQLLVGLDSGRLEGHVSFDRIANPWPDTLTAGAIRSWLMGSDHWDGEVAADSLPLDHLGRFAPAARGWGGRVDGRVTVGGSPRRPELGLAAEARSLRRDSLVVDAVSARATYRDGRLEVSELRVR